MGKDARHLEQECFADVPNTANVSLVGEEENGLWVQASPSQFSIKVLLQLVRKNALLTSEVC